MNSIEHVLSVHLIAESRKLTSKDTFLCFIDFKKAFDCVNRNLLWYKLQLYGLNGALLNNISGLYKDVRYCVEVNNQLSNYFCVSRGVKRITGVYLVPHSFQSFYQ